MQEYGLLQVSSARHRADLQPGSLNFVIFLARSRSLVSFSNPALMEIDVRCSASASDHYHAGGCGQHVYKRILPYHLRL